MEPQFEIIEEDRLPYAWPTCFLLFAFIIGLVLVSFFSAPKPSPQELIASTESRLRRDILIQAVQEYFGTPEMKKSPGRDDLFPKELLPMRARDVRVAELYVVTQFQQSKKISSADLDLISRKGNPADEAFAKVYAAPELSSERADAIRRELPGEPFEYQMARMHALQKAHVPNATREIIPEYRIATFIIVIVVFILAIFGGIVLWFVYFGMRSSGKLAPLGHPAGWLTPGGADRYALRTAQYLAAYVLVSFIVGLTRRQLHVPAVISETLASMLIIGLLPLFILVPVGGKRILPRLQGWHTEHLGKNIGWGLAASLANLPVFFILALLGAVIFQGFPTQEHPVITQITTRTNIWTALLLMAVASISAPIFEETLFRGTFLPALSSRFGSVVTAIIISSLFFAAMHPTGPPSWLPLGWIAALSALLTYQTRSLIPSVIMHSAFNFGQVLLLLTIR